VDLIISPTTVAFNTQPGAPTPTFQAGEVVNALVLQLLENGNVRLSIGNSLLDVQTLVPLVPGTTVRLAVKSTSDGIKLVILDNGAASAAANGAAAPPGRGAASTPVAINAAGVGGAGVSDAFPASAEPSGPTAPLVSPAPADQAVPAVALAQAVRVAAVQQNGLAPLFADVAEAVAPGNAAVLPQPVRDAAEQLLALRPTLDGNLGGQDVKQAFIQSGLFLEARIAAANAGAVPRSASNGDSVARAAPASAAGPATPAAAGALTGSQVPAPAEDLKAALTVFRQVLETWLAAGAPAAAATDAAPARAGLLPMLPEGPSLAPDAPSSEAEARPQGLLPIPSAPPPPYRGAPTAPQPAAAPSIPAGTDPQLIAARLLKDTDGALSRQTLLQAASLPDSANAQGTQVVRGDTSGPRWNFEIPFATPQGTAIAQFEIARDGRSVPAEGIKPVWRARFTIDIEPMGAVHAQVALIGSRTAVTLWAERGESAAKLRQNSSLLSDALKQAELEPGDVLVREGSPPQPRQAAPAGRFLDRAS
jgi:Flagellar hook-length control protein FliK